FSQYFFAHSTNSIGISTVIRAFIYFSSFCPGHRIGGPALNRSQGFSRTHHIPSSADAIISAWNVHHRPIDTRAAPIYTAHQSFPAVPAVAVGLHECSFFGPSSFSSCAFRISSNTFNASSPL